MKVSQQLRIDAANLKRGAMFSPQIWNAYADRVQGMEDAVERVSALLDERDALFGGVDDVRCVDVRAALEGPKP